MATLKICDDDSAFVDLSAIVRRDDERLSRILVENPLNWLKTDIAAYSVIDSSLTVPLAQLSRFMPPLIRYDPAKPELIVHAGLVELMMRQIFVYEQDRTHSFKLTFHALSPRSGNTEYAKVLTNAIAIITQFLETYEFDTLNMGVNTLADAHASYPADLSLGLFTAKVADKLVSAIREIINLEAKLA